MFACVYLSSRAGPRPQLAKQLHGARGGVHQWFSASCALESMGTGEHVQRQGWSFDRPGWGVRIGLFHMLFVIPMHGVVEDTGVVPPKERIDLRFLWNIGREEQESQLLSMPSSMGTSLPLSEMAHSWNTDLKLGIHFPCRNDGLHGD